MILFLLGITEFFRSVTITFNHLHRSAVNLLATVAVSITIQLSMCLCFLLAR